MNSTICTLLCVFAPECANNLEEDSCREILDRDVLLEWEKEAIQIDLQASDGRVDKMICC